MGNVNAHLWSASITGLCVYVVYSIHLKWSDMTRKSAADKDGYHFNSCSLTLQTLFCNRELSANMTIQEPYILRSLSSFILEAHPWMKERIADASNSWRLHSSVSNKSLRSEDLSLTSSASPQKSRCQLDGKTTLQPRVWINYPEGLASFLARVRHNRKHNGF